MDFSYLDDWMDEEAGAGEIEETGEGYRNVWVLAEPNGTGLSTGTLEVMGQARDLADQIGVYVYGVLVGEGRDDLGQALIRYGADKVLVVDHPAMAEYQPEVFGEALASLVDRYRPEILLMPASPLGNDLAPCLAQRLNTGLISHCIKLDIDMSERLLLGTFPTLGGEVFHTCACAESRPQMATLEPGHFSIPYEDAYHSGEVESLELDLNGKGGRLKWIDLDAKPTLDEVKLPEARIVVSAGRGMGDEQGFALVEALAARLGGVIAGSRGAYDEGWIAEEQIVGVGGAFIAPDLYIACGVSGDIYHYFGLQDARYVVAINADAEAPIMKAANIAVVGDARQVIPAMLEAMD